MIRTSERQTFITCRQRWWWSYVEQLEPKTASPALRFGTLVHKAMEARYPPGIKRGPHPAETFLKLYEAELEEQEKIGFRDEDGEWADAAEIGVGILEEFIREFGQDDRYRVLQSEQTFRTRIAKGVIYVGTVDGIWQDRKTKKLLLKEWKTTAQFWSDHLVLDEQAGSYWAFVQPWLRQMGWLGDKATISGILYTFLRKGKVDDRPKDELGRSLNKDGTVSKKQPTPLIARHLVYRNRFDQQMIRARAVAQAEEMKLVRNGTMSLYKSPTLFHCRGCPFKDPCELHETGADYLPLLRAGYKKYDPYDAHHIYEEGRH